jgi:hypothetical protein
VYALGIDAGKITPKTVLADVPGNFAGYAPENFDRQFNGPVTWRSRCVFPQHPGREGAARRRHAPVLQKLKVPGSSRWPATKESWAFRPCWAAAA